MPYLSDIQLIDPWKGDHSLKRLRKAEHFMEFNEEWQYCIGSPLPAVDRGSLNFPRLGPQVNMASESSLQILEALSKHPDFSNLMDFSEKHPRRLGVVLGSGMGNLGDLEAWYAKVFRDGQKRLPPFLLPGNMNSSPASLTAIALGAKGPVESVSTACASALSALFRASDWIESGQADVVLFGALDRVHSQLIHMGWQAMRALSKAKVPNEACLPMDKRRQGLVLAEGGGIGLLVHEKLKDHFTAKVKLVGKGQSTDAVSLTAPDSEGMGSAIASALKVANTVHCDAIVCHATGTLANDREELKALQKCISQPKNLQTLKAQTGHALGGSAMFSLAAGIDNIVQQKLFPMHHLQETIAEANFVRDERPSNEIKAVLVNAFAFGGINLSAVLQSID